MPRTKQTPSNDSCASKTVLLAQLSARNCPHLKSALCAAITPAPAPQVAGTQKNAAALFYAIAGEM
jgi:hypothetical protein